MKLIKEWLEMLPEPYKTQALCNFKGYKGFGYAGTQPIALLLAFKFTRTPEGGKYWDSVYEMSRRQIFVKPIVKKPKQKIVKVKLPRKNNVSRHVIEREANGKISKVAIVYNNIDETLEAILKNKDHGN